jgi:PKD repeat protein
MKTKIFTLLASIFMVGAINAQCPITITYQANSTNNGEVSFVSSSFVGANFVVWDFGDGGSGYGASINHVFATGTYTVCATAVDSLNNINCTTCTQVTVTNNGGGSTCNANFVVYDSLGSVYIYDMSTGSNLSYYWTFGDNTDSYTSGSQVHQYAQSGTYQICLVVSNPNNCTDTYCSTEIISFGGGGGGLCNGNVNPYFTSTVSGSVAYFNNTPSAAGQTYFWDFGDGTADMTIGNIAHTYSSPGNYSVCLTVYQNGTFADSCSYCSTVSIGQTPNCNAYFSIIQDSTNIYNYMLYNYSNGSSPNALVNYFWDFGDNNSSTLAYPSHTYTGSGPYQICLTITTQGMGATCTSTFCDTIVPGLAPMQNTTIQVYNPLMTGILSAKESLETMNSFPNPFSENMTIAYELASTTSVELSINSIIGEQVMQIEKTSKSAGKHTLNVDGSNLKNGIYLLQLKTTNGTITKKVIVSK